MAEATVNTRYEEKVVTQEVKTLTLELSLEEAVLVRKVLGGVSPGTEKNRELIRGIYSTINSKIHIPLSNVFKGTAPELCSLEGVTKKSRFKE